MTEHIEFDAVVIGAGVVGLAIAKELCNHFDNVIVLDKESDFGQHVSSRHSGVIHSGIYYESGSLKAQLCVEGNELIYDYAENNNIDYLKCGKLIVGHDDSDLQKLRELKEKGTSNGVKDLRIISHEEALKIQPGLICSNALWVPSTGIIDSHNLMLHLEKEISTKGGLVYYNSEVTNISKQKEIYNLELLDQDSIIFSPVVVNSAGLWSDAVSSMLGIDNYKIHYCKGDYYKSNRYKDMNCLIYPLPGKLGLGIHSVLQLDGSVSFGPNAYYVDDISYEVDEENLDKFHLSINKYLDINKDEIFVDYSGIRPKPYGLGEEPKDFTIKNEESHGFPNFINLIGIESPGLTCSLAIGHYVKNLLT